jgi:FkbM family methyltransferase
VVFFHGHPRPHEVTTGWVPEVWKIGGGSGVEWVVTSNVETNNLRENVKHALSIGCKWLEAQPEHEGSACIVGGGPSLKDTLFYIRGMQMAGSYVFATGNSYAYLKANGIQPDAHVLLDARAENLSFVPDDDTPKYYASQCHPSVLDKARNLTAWHCAHSAYEDAFSSHPSSAVQLGGGTTVGLKTVALAYAMGFRNLRLFGFDSSYGDTHHAYPQALNDSERVLEAKVGGETFRAAPWMIAQAEEFKETVAALVHMGCMVTVYGKGLLPKVAEEMGKTIREIDGLYWPAADSETRASVLMTLGDIDKILTHVPSKRTVVQAGGNVGVWPKELAKHFERVVTFEPDPINWECLEKNVKETNVWAFNAALGDKPGKIGIHHDTFNCGASRVVEGDSVTVRTVDDLRLDSCDLIQLDIEGYEFHALKGAVETIQEHSPVIVLEQKGLENAYGVGSGEIAEWLGQFGYKKAEAIHRDVIYTRTV